MKTTMRSFIAGALAMLAVGSASAITVTASNDANALATAIGGSGVTITGATLATASSTAAGLFTGGGSAVGFDNGVLLTTGTVNCAPGPNTSTSCGDGSGTTTSLKFNFTSDTGNIFFKYVFASEEYNEYVGKGFNDIFQLLLNGTNIALLPGSAGVVSIDNVNLGSNSAYYRNNTGAGSLNLDTQYDGLTTTLTASAFGITGTNTFEFVIKDNGDAILDSGVFIQAGTFSGTNTDVPEPSSIALLGVGLAGLVARRRKKA